jgi:hypothetical protein
MRYGKSLGLVGVFLLSATFTVKADVWDIGDNGPPPATIPRNHLVHGSDQVHDLAAQGGVADQDWYLHQAAAFSSYEIVIDGTSIGLASSSLTRRTFADPTTVLQTSFAIDGGQSLGMMWQNTGDVKQSQLIVVDGATVGCTTCTADAQYRIRLFDTTFAIPRFNNANGQVTVLLVQNALAHQNTAGSADAVPWTANYWSAAGTLLTQVPGTLAPRQTAVINLSTIPELQGQTGAITVTHLAGYGGLAVKSVALEPATGFSFDTLGTYRSR